jgi:hypothetical protein
MPGCREGAGVSIVIGQSLAKFKKKPPPLAIRACAWFEQRVGRPLAIRDRRRYERRATASIGETWQREFGSAREWLATRRANHGQNGIIAGNSVSAGMTC